VLVLSSLPFEELLSLSSRPAVGSGARDGRHPGPGPPLLDAAAMEEEEEERLGQLQRWDALPIGNSRRKVAQAPSPPLTGSSRFGSEVDAVAEAEECEVPMWSSRARYPLLR
jgi:hypothetical protein